MQSIYHLPFTHYTRTSHTPYTRTSHSLHTYITTHTHTLDTHTRHTSHTHTHTHTQTPQSSTANTHTHTHSHTRWSTPDTHTLQMRTLHGSVHTSHKSMSINYRETYTPCEDMSSETHDSACASSPPQSTRQAGDTDSKLSTRSVNGGRPIYTAHP